MKNARTKASQSAKKTTQKADDRALRQRVLDSVLRQVAFDGWTKKALQAALTETGVEEGRAQLMFPQGIRDLLDLFETNADQAMLQAIERQHGFARLRVRDKVAFAVRKRLEYLTPHREALRRAMAWYALPSHLPLAFRRISVTVDLIWKQAGDQATDFNFYTKRFLLAGVIKATVLFWLSDDTQGAQASWEFLDRRIGEVLKLGKSISLLKEFRPSEILDLVKRKLRA